MIPDPAATAGLVTREVRTGSRDGARTRIVVARRTYPTDRADLWSALTDPERLPRWFLPVSGELREGGRYQLEGNAGGRIERCEEPSSFDVTWEYGDSVTWLTVTLTPAGDGSDGSDRTTLELVHEAPDMPEMWDTFGPGAVGIGWDLGLMALGLHLDSGQPVDPQEGLTFPLTPPGREFVRTAATDWAAAQVADGEDERAAHEAGDRSYAFYTTAPEPDAEPEPESEPES